MTPLAPFLDKYIAGRKDLAPASRVSMTQTRNRLVSFFGATRSLDKITPGDADDFSHWLHANLGDNTARRTLGRAKQFFRAAQRKRLISNDPLAELRGTSVRPNSTREFSVGRDLTDRIMEACHTNRWQLVLALARYGGLRVPSELHRLTWHDIDFQQRRLTVHSPKTARHGKHSRVVPMFPELRPYLAEGWRQAQLIGQGPDDPVIPPHQASTIRRGLLVILKRAGIKPWPKLFQNLRSSRQTELADQFPVHTVCKWLGNSPAVALKFYLRVLDSHFQAAIEGSQ